MIKWLYENYILSSVVALTYMVLVCFGTYQIFFDITQINGSAAAAYATLMGLPAAIAGILKWRFDKDNK